MSVVVSAAISSMVWVLVQVFISSSRLWRFVLSFLWGLALQVTFHVGCKVDEGLGCRTFGLEDSGSLAQTGTSRHGMMLSSTAVLSLADSLKTQQHAHTAKGRKATLPRHPYTRLHPKPKPVMSDSPPATSASDTS